MVKWTHFTQICDTILSLITAIFSNNNELETFWEDGFHNDIYTSIYKYFLIVNFLGRLILSDMLTLYT